MPDNSALRVSQEHLKVPSNPFHTGLPFQVFPQFMLVLPIHFSLSHDRKRDFVPFCHKLADILSGPSLLLPELVAWKRYYLQGASKVKVQILELPVIAVRLASLRCHIHK